jgi:catechol 2,3-dioxygenase-like lactoylglutathione lyase family enzyme
VIDHLWVRVADLAAARAFYETIGPIAGFGIGSDGPGRVQLAGDRGSFSIVDGTPSEHLHMAFPAADRETVEAFHRTATGAGYRDNGPPGERPEHHPGYYGAFVLDPDGNNVEVVSHNR